MTPRHHAGVGDDLGKEGFQMAKGDYRQGQNETGIATHQPLTADGWTIVDGAPEQAIRIDSGTFEMGPMVGLWRCTPGVDGKSVGQGKRGSVRVGLGVSRRLKK